MGATSSAAQGQQGLHVGTGPYCPKALDLGTGGGSRVDPTGQSQATVQGGCRPGKLGASSLTLGYGATAGIGSRRAEAGAATSRMRPDLAELVQSGDPRGGCACGEGFFPVVSPLILRSGGQIHSHTHHGWGGPAAAASPRLDTAMRGAVTASRDTADRTGQIVRVRVRGQPCAEDAPYARRTEITRLAPAVCIRCPYVRLKAARDMYPLDLCTSFLPTPKYRAAIPHAGQ